MCILFLFPNYTDSKVKKLASKDGADSDSNDSDSTEQTTASKPKSIVSFASRIFFLAIHHCTNAECTCTRGHVWEYSIILFIFIPGRDRTVINKWGDSSRTPKPTTTTTPSSTGSSQPAGGQQMMGPGERSITTGWLNVLVLLLYLLIP